MEKEKKITFQCLFDCYWMLGLRFFSLEIDGEEKSMCSLILVKEIL